jgi:hypothetical protein
MYFHSNSLKSVKLFSTLFLNINSIIIFFCKNNYIRLNYKMTLGCVTDSYDGTNERDYNTGTVWTYPLGDNSADMTGVVFRSNVANGAFTGVPLVAGQAEGRLPNYNDPKPEKDLAVGNTFDQDVELAGNERNITISDVIKAGTVENAYHNKVLSNLVSIVAGLSADPIVNIINTLSGKKGFDLAGWAPLGPACQAGNIDLGFLDSAGRVQAIFQAGGTAYVNAKYPDDSLGWYGLNGPSMPNAVEAPEATAARLRGISQAANAPIRGSKFTGTFKAYQAPELPRALPEGGFKFEPLKSYAGITVKFPETSYQIVASKEIALERRYGN